MADRSGDAGGPDRCPVGADGNIAIGQTEPGQRAPGNGAPGEAIRLPLGDGAFELIGKRDSGLREEAGVERAAVYRRGQENGFGKARIELPGRARKLAGLRIGHGGPGKMEQYRAGLCMLPADSADG